MPVLQAFILQMQSRVLTIQKNFLLLQAHRRDEKHLLISIILQVFEKGNFAGLEEMKSNERLFNRVAPMGVNDIMMAVQYKHVPAQPLNVPIVAFDGLDDYTIDRGNMDFWEGYTAAGFKLMPIQGDHYFVSSQYRKVYFVCLLLLSALPEPHSRGIYVTLFYHQSSSFQL